ncbi:MAG: hypothetical protein WC855_03745 [Thermodesulfovibrionales bacterium]
MLYPIINAFCSDSGLSFNDAKSKLSSGAVLEFTSKEQADNAAAKYKKLGCSVTEELIETTSEETGVARVWICAGCGNENKLSLEKCDCGYNLYQESNEPLCASTDNKPVDDSEEVNTGFAGIGKRIEDLEMGGGTEDAKAWKQAIAEPEQKKQESVKQETTQKVYAPKATKKTVPSFRLSFAKVFWGIVGLVIIVSMFSEKNNKKTSNYKPSGQTTPQDSTPTSVDDDYVTVGQYRCSLYHQNKAQELLPSVYEKQSLESESSALDSLKIEIETAYVDHYSQSSIDRHNMLISDYNSRLELHKLNLASYNNKVETYNNYLMSNCSKAY